MQQHPKKIKRLLSEHMIEAYERELHRELTISFGNRVSSTHNKIGDFSKMLKNL